MTRPYNLSPLIIRLSAGGLMLLYGIHKLVDGISQVEQLVLAKGFPAFVANGVYLGEVIAPILMIIGYKTRAASAVFLLNAFAAIYFGHSGEIFTLNSQGGLSINLLVLFIASGISLLITGGGRFALTRGRWMD